MVGEVGLEPTRISPLAPKASVSTIPPLARLPRFDLCQRSNLCRKSYRLLRKVLRISYRSRSTLVGAVVVLDTSSFPTL